MRGTCEDARQRPKAGVGGHQRRFVRVPLVARQDLLQPVVHGHHQHPVTDLLPLGVLKQTEDEAEMNFKVSGRVFVCLVLGHLTLTQSLLGTGTSKGMSVSRKSEWSRASRVPSSIACRWESTSNQSGVKTGLQTQLEEF